MNPEEVINESEIQETSLQLSPETQAPIAIAKGKPCGMCAIEVTSENKAPRSWSRCIDCHRIAGSAQKDRTTIVVKADSTISEIEEKILKRHNKKATIKDLEATINELSQKKQDIKLGKVDITEIAEKIVPDTKSAAQETDVVIKKAVVPKIVEAVAKKVIKAKKEERKPDVVPERDFLQEEPIYQEAPGMRRLFRRQVSSYIPKQAIDLTPRIPGKYRR